MSRRTMTLAGYLASDETNRPFELAYGVVREPAAPIWGHQIVVGRIHGRLTQHVRRFDLGRLVDSPIDVVLDRRRALVVQPDLVFVSTGRLDICTEQIWGAPDLVIEVLSSATKRHDGVVKVTWYERYGVSECWLVDPVSCEVTVINLTGATRLSRVFTERQQVRSAVLPRLRLQVATVFHD